MFFIIINIRITRYCTLFLQSKKKESNEIMKLKQEIKFNTRKT